MYLEHLQAIFQEFDSVAAPNKNTMIRYFRKSFQLSIRAQLDVRNRDLDSWNEIVDKTINAEAKTTFKLYPGQKRWIFDALKVNGQPRKMTKISKILKRISLSRIFLLILYHHPQVGPNFHWHSQPKKTRIVVFAEKDSDVKAKTRVKILLLLA